MAINTTSITFRSGSRGGASPSSSIAILELDPDDVTGGSFQIRVPSGSIKGGNREDRTPQTDRILMYFSGSGEVGIGTKNPTGSLDIRDPREDTVEGAKTKVLQIDRDKGQDFQTPVTASIVSASTSIESLQYYGNNIGTIQDNYIYLTPGDFYADGNPDVRNPHTIGDNGAYLADGSRLEYHAMAVIPKGYKATHAIVYDNNPASSTYTVYSSSVGGSGGALSAGQAGAATATNTEKDITDITGGSGFYCILVWDPGAATNRCYGGRITLAKV